jgi:type IX secretion system substrate protein
MGKILRYFIVSTLLLSSTYVGRASHLAGYDFTYVFVDSAAGIYHYRVSLSIYQDCLNGQPAALAQDNPAYLAVYTGSGTLIRNDSVSYSVADSMPITANGSCGKGAAPLCVNKKTFVIDYHLPASATGYTITYQRCCLNPTPVNLDSPNLLGISCYCSIPPSGTTTHNSSALFTNYPPFIIEMNVPLTFDCSATDADGDSLSYALCSAYSGDLTLNTDPDPPGPPPFVPLTYISPFTSGTPMSTSVPLTINPVTGALSCTPDATGTYVITVCCSEWRHGLFINTIQREFEFTVANCKLNAQVLSNSAAEMLFPNPATKELSISGATRITSVVICNLVGQTVYTKKFNSEKVQVNIADLAKGIYLVRINGAEVRKFVKE